MRQPSDDRARYYRGIRNSLSSIVRPELSSAGAIDVVTAIDRILVKFIVEEEAAESLSAEYGAQLHQALKGPPEHAITPSEFHALRQAAAESVDTTIAHDLAAIELRFLDAHDTLHAEVQFNEPVAAAKTPVGCSVTPEQVTAYLREHVIGAATATATSVAVVPGGRSKETIFVHVVGADGLPDEFVLRKDRQSGALLATSAADEYAVIRAVHEYGGIPCPRPLHQEPDPDKLGGTFLLMNRVPGVRAGDHFAEMGAPPVEDRPELVRQLARALARMHTMPISLLAGTHVDLSPPPLSVDSVVASVLEIKQSVDRLSGEPNICIGQAFDWLLSHPEHGLVDVPLGIVQGDVGLHNTLIDGPNISALVDWELTRVAPAVVELAKIWDLLDWMGLWDDFEREYLDSGGAEGSCDPRALQFYRLLYNTWAFMLTRTMSHMFRTGVRSDLVAGVSGLDSLFRRSRDLARALDDITRLGLR